MSVKKDVSKTLRLDQSVVDYIMTFGGKGESFSACFNAMIHLFRDAEKDLRDRQQTMKNQLELRQKDYDRIAAKLCRLDHVTYELFEVDAYIKRIRQDLVKLQDDS